MISPFVEWLLYRSHLRLPLRPFFHRLSVIPFVQNISVVLFSAYVIEMILYLVWSFIFVSLVQVCRLCTSYQSVLCNFSVPDYYMKISVTIFSACVHRNDLIFGLELYHGELYSVSPSQVCRPSTCFTLLYNFQYLIFTWKFLLPFSQLVFIKMILYFQNKILIINLNFNQLDPIGKIKTIPNPDMNVLSIVVDFIKQIQYMRSVLVKQSYLEI